MNSTTRLSTAPGARTALLGIGLLILLLAPAHGRATETAPGAWSSIFISGKLGGDNSRWLFYTDAQYRYFDFGEGLFEYLVRPAVGYAINDKWRAWAGYGRFRNEADPNIVVDENRYWQQIDWSDTALLGGRASLRARTEQRDVSFSSDLRQVLRLMARYQRPLPGSFLTDWFVSVEPFFDLNTTDWGGGTGISQNRAQLGLGMTVQPGLRLEAGFMQQYFYLDNRENRASNLAILNLKWQY